MKKRIRTGERRSLVFATIAVLALGPGSTSILGLTASRVLHISPLGDDETGDGSTDNPWATIQHGIDRSVSGDTLLLADTTFAGPGNHDLLIEGKTLVIASTGGDPEACVIDCEYDASGRQCGLTFRPDGASLDLIGLSIVRAKTNAVWVDGYGNELRLNDCILADAGDAGVDAPACRIHMQGGQVRGTVTGLRLWGGNRCEFHDALIADNETGVVLGQGEHHVFSGCWFTHNGTGIWGIGYKKAAEAENDALQISSEFQDCHFIDNGYGVEIELWGTFSRCEFLDNTVGGARLFYPSRVTFDDCDVHGNQGDGISSSVLELTIIGSRVTGNTGRGLTSVGGWSGSGLTVTNTLIACNGGTGLELTTNSTWGNSNISINGSTIAGNAAGVSASASGDVSFVDTVIAFNTGEGLCTDQAAYVNCAVYGNGPDICPDAWTPGVNGNIAADPLFCDRAQCDWTVAENSPCLASDQHPQIGATGVGCGPIYRGRIVIDAEPDSAITPWRLDGPDALIVTGDSDSILVSMPVGTYTHHWLPSDGWSPPVPGTIDADLAPDSTLMFVGTYGPQPCITGVIDVGNDQGSQVRLIWNRCWHDAPGNAVTILRYGIYRRQDDARDKENFAGGARRLEGWDFVAELPARGDTVYQTIVPTLCDSTAGGICWSVFMVSAESQYPLVYFDSAPDSGYSVNNLDISAVTWRDVRQPFALLPSVPNPFSLSTVLHYTLDVVGPVTLEIYDLQGRRVRTVLPMGQRGPGPGMVIWDGMDEKGRIVPAGIYMSTIRAGERASSRRLSIVR